MKLLALVAVMAVAAVVAEAADSLPPSCDRPVYCDSQLLHHVQMNRLYPDSKTFVDLQMKYNENTTLSEFNALLNRTNNNPTKDELITFVADHFDNGTELEAWEPTDYSANPVFLATVRDDTLRQFAKDVIAIWPTLGRKVKSIVNERPEQFSFIPVTHGFIIPGGRFTELYYWDTYWIIEGLLISDMNETVKGVLENLLELLAKIGHIPNGSRWYYQQRSQPPLLTAMVSIYFRHTKDVEFLRANIKALENEIQYWLDTQRITFSLNERAYTLLRYYVPSEGPRPESYYEDYINAQRFNTTERKQEFYTDIKSAAESGWDFSSRWFIDGQGDNTGNLTNINTKSLIPVDLNSIFANALQNLAYFHGVLGNRFEAAHWLALAAQWRADIEAVLWDEKDGVWYDYDVKDHHHRKYFFPSNVAPLWMGAVDKLNIKKKAPQVIKYLQESNGLDFPGGVPTSLSSTGEQWDFPNAWPPLVSVVVNALEALETDEGNKMAFDVAETWVRACFKGFNDTKHMYEKYDAENAGKYGAGGEYQVQNGFGWSNGVVLEFLAKYGQEMKAHDSPTTSTNGGPSKVFTASKPINKSAGAEIPDTPETVENSGSSLALQH